MLSLKCMTRRVVLLCLITLSGVINNECMKTSLVSARLFHAAYLLFNKWYSSDWLACVWTVLKSAFRPDCDSVVSYVKQSDNTQSWHEISKIFNKQAERSAVDEGRRWRRIQRAFFLLLTGDVRLFDYSCCHKHLMILCTPCIPGQM